MAAFAPSMTEATVIDWWDNWNEFQEIRKFTTACRQYWPGAAITLRPNSDFAPSGASAPSAPETAPESNDHERIR
jgi:hypothetical protein